MAGIFRAYDIRGIYPAELNEGIAYKIGLAYAGFMKKNSGMKDAVVGMDSRLSSPSLKKAVISGLRSGGISTTDIGMVPTPVFYFAIMHCKKQGGIMVTGSHNPKDQNGFKLQREDALPVSGEDGIYEIEKMINKGGLRESGGKTKISKENIVPAYIEFVASKIKLAKPLKVIIDCGNGACSDIPERIFKKLGCRVKTLFAKPDGNFPNHLPDPHEPQNLKPLQKAVLKEKADLGIAYDGDADRMGIVDARGRIVPTDFILMALARQALEHFQAYNSALKRGANLERLENQDVMHDDFHDKKGNVVFEVRCPMTLLEDVKAHGGIPHMAKAGRVFVRNEVRRLKAVFGGELTGHIFIPYCYYDYDDGIFASAKVAEIASQKNFAEYIDSMPKAIASPEIFVETTEERKFAAVDELKALLKKRKYDFLGIDGARINFKNGWGLVRASNTTPHIKCRFEADTQKHLDEIIAEVRGLMKEVGVELKI